jgi:hypothetical protein
MLMQAHNRSGGLIELITATAMTPRDEPTREDQAEHDAKPLTQLLAFSPPTQGVGAPEASESSRSWDTARDGQINDTSAFQAEHHIASGGLLASCQSTRPSALCRALEWARAHGGPYLSLSRSYASWHGFPESCHNRASLCLLVL